MTRNTRPLAATAGMILIAFSMLAPAAKTDATPDERPAIRKVLDDQVKAWNRGDLKGFMAGYWRSEDLSFFSGKNQTRGWQATLERYQKRYQADGKEIGKLVFSELVTELAGQDHAWVRGRWDLAQGQEKHGGLFTLILKKQPEGWRIIHDHTSGD